MIGKAGERKADISKADISKAGVRCVSGQDSETYKYYEDIINLPHPTSKKHLRMSALERAAQFSPFAALTGYEDAVKETGRMTEQKAELSEEQKAAIDAVIREAEVHLAKSPLLSVTYFEPDPRKAGGEYVQHAGRLKKIDDTEGRLLFTDGKVIEFSDIAKIHFTNSV